MSKEKPLFLNDLGYFKMGRHSNYPVILEYCKSISIAELKKLGFLEKDIQQGGTVRWSRPLVGTDFVRIIVCFTERNPFVEFSLINDYYSRYRVKLVSMPSNIGKGRVWFFECPVTKRRCRKLHSYGGRFIHRSAINPVFYECQTYSRQNCSREKKFDLIFKTPVLKQALNAKYSKRYYGGLPTKRYKRIQAGLIKASKITFKDLFDYE